MVPIWPTGEEAVAVVPSMRTHTSTTGAPPDTGRVIVSSPEPCRVVIGVDDDTPFVAELPLHFVGNPQPGQTITVGPPSGVITLTFVDVLIGNPYEVLVEPVLSGTLARLASVLEPEGYAVDLDQSDRIRLQVTTTYGPQASCWTLFSDAPLADDQRNILLPFRGSVGTFVPANFPMEFYAQPQDRCYVLGDPTAVNSMPESGGGATVTWATAANT